MLPALSSAQDGAQTIPPDSVEQIQAADKVIRNYMTAVADQIGGKLEELGGQKAILKKFEELGEEHLLPHKDVLHSKAKADYLKLDVLKLGENDKLEAIEAHAKKLGERVDTAFHLTTIILSPRNGGIPNSLPRLCASFFSAKLLVRKKLGGANLWNNFWRQNYIEETATSTNLRWPTLTAKNSSSSIWSTPNWESTRSTKSNGSPSRRSDPDAETKL